MLIRILLPVLLLFPAPLLATNATPLGKTLLARGAIHAERQGSNTTLVRSNPIFRTDTIRSGNDSIAQFRMIDDALIELLENSELRLKSYELQKESNSGSVVMELLSGGLRTISGLIGKQNKDEYQLKTPSATIGIRGTMYEAQLVEGGMYLGVWRGDISIQTYSGLCNLEIGHGYGANFAFINNGGECEILREAPRIFSTNRRKADEADDPSNAEPQNKKQPPTPVASAPRKPLQVALPNQALVIGQGSNLVNKGRTNSINTLTPLISAGGQLIHTPTTPQNYQQSIGGYPVNWGRWDSYATQDLLENTPNPVTDADGLIWAAYEASNPETVAARTGTVRYDSMVGSLAESNLGMVNDLKVQMDVNFGTGKVSNGALSAHVPDHTWAGTFNGQVQQGNLSLNFTGGSLVNTQTGDYTLATGSIDGDFVGNHAQGIVGGFNMTDTLNTNNQINGTFLVEDTTAQ